MPNLTFCRCILFFNHETTNHCKQILEIPFAIPSNTYAHTLIQITRTHTFTSLYQIIFR